MLPGVWTLLADITPCRGQDGPDLCGETGVGLCGLRPSELDTGPRPLTEAAIGFQRQRPENAHQRTLVRGKREPLGSTKDKEGAMSAVVGIDVATPSHLRRRKARNDGWPVQANSYLDPRWSTIHFTFPLNRRSGRIEFRSLNTHRSPSAGTHRPSESVSTVQLGCRW
jgi:hypothetical protein